MDGPNVIRSHWLSLICEVSHRESWLGGSRVKRPRCWNLRCLHVGPYPCFWPEHMEALLATETVMCTCFWTVYLGFESWKQGFLWACLLPMDIDSDRKASFSQQDAFIRWNCNPHWGWLHGWHMSTHSWHAADTQLTRHDTHWRYSTLSYILLKTLSQLSGVRLIISLAFLPQVSLFS